MRTGLIVGSFVPLTMMLGLILMRFVDVELERVSIASTIIALGMLVDNGIVIAEEIRSAVWSAARIAAVPAWRRVRAWRMPLLTSSLTTIFAFMPMLLMQGQTGDYAYSLPMVVVLLLLASWFLSMFVTPSMCFWFMKVDDRRSAKKRQSQDSQAAEDPYGGSVLSQRYRNFVTALLRQQHPGARLVRGARRWLAGGYRCFPDDAGVLRPQRSQSVSGVSGSPCGLRHRGDRSAACSG